MKRGQIAVFIIIGLILALTVMVVLLLQQEQQVPEVKTTSDGAFGDDVYDFVQFCLESSVPQAIQTVSSTGGLFTDTTTAIPYGFGFVQLHFAENDILTPSFSTVENELSSAIQFSLLACVDEFDSFVQYTIEEQGLTVKSTLEPESLKVVVDYPLIITQQEKKRELHHFETMKFTRIYDLHQAATEITQLFSLDSDNVCMSCLSDIADKKEIDVEVYPYNDQTLLYRLTLNESDEHLIYAFAHEVSE